MPEQNFGYGPSQQDSENISLRPSLGYQLMSMFSDKPQSASAADTRARLAREDYADWLRTFRPIENELIAQYDNPALRERSVAEAQQLTMQGLAGAQESLGRRNAELGISLTQGQQKSLDRQMNLAGGLALVNAANQTRRRIDDRDQQLLTGISPQGSSLRYAQGQ